jgi:hypothetical protein
VEHEALEILNMVREGKVTAEQGAELLEALRTPSSPTVAAAGGKPKFVRVKVDIKGGGKETVAVNVNLPVALADLALKLAEGAKFQHGDRTIVLGDYVKQFSGMDMGTILQLVKEGAQGKLVDVNIGGNEGETVKVEVVVD